MLTPAERSELEVAADFLEAHGMRGVEALRRLIRCRVVVYYPRGYSAIRYQDGVRHTANAELATELLQSLANGDDVVLPSDRDQFGNRMWSIEAAIMPDAALERQVSYAPDTQVT